MSINEASRAYGAQKSSIREIAAYAGARKAEIGAENVFDFSLGNPSIPAPDAVRASIERALALPATQLHGYTPANGLPAVREAVAASLCRRFGDGAASAGDLYLTCGAAASLSITFHAIVNPGDEVIIPTPCWVSYPEIVRIVGGVPVLVQGDVKKGFVTEAEDLAPYVTERTKALILNSPNNPNGCIWNREQLAGIAELAVEKGFYVVSDEIYEKLIYDGEEHVSIASLGEDIFRQTIVINGVSKSYAMTGWRIGYTAGPIEVIRAMSSLQSQVASGSNSIAQYAAEEALRSPKGREAIERMHRAYDERRRHIVQRLNAIDGLNCVMPKGAFYVMVDMSALIGKHLGDRQIGGSMDFADMLLENANVALTTGTAFCAEGYCRISYATSMEQIDKGVDRIEHFVNNLV